jgi:site-specific DNA recombinase
MARKIACIYPRKSRENAVTLDGQIQACVDWCNRNDVEYDIFAEEGSASSEDWNRPKLQEMIKAVQNYEYNLVVVTEQTRICRDDHFPIFKEILRDTETLFVTADNNSIFDFSNPDDELKSDILQAVGKNELSRTKIRLKRGTVQSAKKGNYQGKKAPVGYEYNHTTKRLKINNDAPVVRRMFEMYLEGYSTTEISHIFIRDNVLAYRKVKGEMVPITWSKSTVARSLKNVVYAGHTLFGKTKLKKIKGKKEQIAVNEEFHILVEDTHEAIVTPEEWNTVQELISKKRSQPPAMKHAKHTFSGLIACEYCGKVHTFEKQKDTKQEWRINSCTTRIYNEEGTKYTMCRNSGCKLHFVESLFFATLENIAKQLEDYIELVKEKKISNEDAQKTKEAKKNAKLVQIDKLKKKRRKMMELIEEGFYDDEDEEKEKMQEIKSIQHEIVALKKEVEEIIEVQESSATVQIEKVLYKIREILLGKGIGSVMDERKVNELLHDFIDKIYYSKDGRNAEPKIHVHLKEDIQEVLKEIDSQTKEIA